MIRISCQLIDYCRKINQIYKGSIYLVGSALYKNKPRDIDIRLVMPDYYFELYFGSIVQWIYEGETGNWSRVRYKWAKTCLQITEILCDKFKMNIDFQIYPQSWLGNRYFNDFKLLLSSNI